jgi:hypothetical protein
VFYTPPALAEQVATLVLGTFCAPPPRILDPCCGDGALLVAAWRYGLGQSWPPTALLASLHGIDLDPVAVGSARDRLTALAVDSGVDRGAAHTTLHQNLVVADGLEYDLGSCDAILTNPPFGNAIEADTARTQHQKERHRALVPEVTTGAYDHSVVFAARALQRLRPGGRYGLILPRSTLSVDSARALRDFVDQHGAPDTLLSPQSADLFEGAAVFVTAVIGTLGLDPSHVRVDDGNGPRRVTRRGGERSWAELLDPALPLLRSIEASPSPLVPLAERYSLRAGATTGVAYELSPLVVEDGAGRKLVTTGLIDRYTCLWGQRRCRYLKHDYQHPRWPEGAAGGVGRASAAQAHPKVLVGGLSRVLEAVADPHGALAGVVSTWVVSPGPGTTALYLCEALLNSPVLALVYATRNRGKEMSGGNITVGKRELGALPVPADLETLGQTTARPLPAGADPLDLDPVRPDHRAILAATAAAAVQREGWAAPNIVDEIRAARAVSRLYGLDAELFDAVQAWFVSRERRS